MVRDNVPFNTLLSADIIYTADAAAGVPAYSNSNNDMYEALDTDGADLSVHLQQKVAVRGHRPADRRHRRRADHARRRLCLLHGRHQPRACTASR